MNGKMMKKISILLVVVLLFSYLIYQAVVISKSDIQTQVALSETVYETIDTKCFVLRDEEFIKNSSDGTVVSFAKNGDRVAADDTVSMIFNDSDDANTYLKISELKKDIEHFEALNGQANIQAMDIKTLDSKINNKLTDYLNSVDTLDFSSANENADSLRDSLTSKQIATGNSLDYSKKLASLKNELEKLEKINLSYSEVKSQKAGYYISGSDGYENAVDFDKIDEITADDIKSAVKSSPQTVDKNVAGRIIENFSWYILCVVDSDKTVSLKLGDTLYVNFPYSGIERLPVEVYKIGERSDGEAMLILKCELMNDSLTDFRIEDIQVIVSEYNGYKIKNSAIRTVDGQTGVYVVSGNLLGFRKVHIVYANDEYSIVNNPEGESGYIRLYDKVVTKGVELYDNKLV